MTNTEDINKFEKQRHEKLSQIKELGIDPYGSKYEGVEPAEEIKARYIEDDPNQRAKAAGRIVSAQRYWQADIHYPS